MYLTPFFFSFFYFIGVNKNSLKKDPICLGITAPLLTLKHIGVLVGQSDDGINRRIPTQPSSSISTTAATTTTANISGWLSGWGGAGCLLPIQGLRKGRNYDDVLIILHFLRFPELCLSFCSTLRGLYKGNLYVDKNVEVILKEVECECIYLYYCFLVVRFRMMSDNTLIPM